MKDKRQKARELITLALNKGTTDQERFSAAMRACELIDKDDLLSSPLDGLVDEETNETIRAVGDIFSRLADPKFVSSIKKVAGSVGRAKPRRR